MGRQNKGLSLSKKKQLREACNAHETFSNTGKENTNPSTPWQLVLSPKSRQIQRHKQRADAAEAENQKLKHEQKNAARREKRHKQKISKLEQEIKEAEDELSKATAHGEAQVRSVLKKRADDEKRWRSRLAEAECRLGEAELKKSATTAELRKKLDVLGQVRRALRLAWRQSNRQQDQVRKLRSSPTSKHVLRMRAKRGRAYKVELRALARVLVTCGCKEGQVGDLMQDIAKNFGIDLDRAMSRRTVRRAVLEGLVASQVQLGAEIKYTEGIFQKIFSNACANKMNRHYHE
jgi:chromosome segregation ATPase